MKKHFVGTCIDSFDVDGNCVVPQLPFDTTSDLGYADENAVGMSKKEFLKNVELDPKMLKLVKSKKKVYLLRFKNVMMIYDPEKDVHHFFV